MTAIAACSGGGGSPTPVGAGIASAAPTSSPNAAQQSVASVAVTIVWPSPVAATSNARHRSFVSPSTASVTITGTGVTATSVNNPNLTAGASTYTKSTTVSVSAAAGSDTFTIGAYDKAATTSGVAIGNLLAQSTTAQTIVMDAANTFSVVLNGNLGKIVAAPVASSIFLTGSFPTFTHIGEAPQTYVITPEDLDGNVIVTPGIVPTLTLASGTPASVTATATSTTNQYVIQAKAPDASVTMTMAGKNLAGTAVTTTFTVNTLAALYVANHGINGASPSVSIYPVPSPIAAATPIGIVSGANTLESSIQFPAVDSNGNLYVSNQGPMPGATFAATAGYVTVFSPAAQSGTNQTPTSVITNLRRPEGLAFDAKNDLYVMLERGIDIYGPSPTASSTPIGYLGVPDPTSAMPSPVDNAELEGCYGVNVGANGTVYAACSDAITYFAQPSTGVPPTGNVAPTGIIQPAGNMTANVPGMATQTFASDSWLGVATDSSSNIYTPSANNNLDMVTEYAAGANDGAGVMGSGSPATPGFTATGAGFNIPWGIAFDAANVSYVSNYAGSTVLIFASPTTLMAGSTAAAATITTGVSSPFGIAVR